MVPVSEEEEETICLELMSFNSGSPSWGCKYGTEQVWCLDLFDRPNLNRDGLSFLVRLRSASISTDSTLYVIGGILNFDADVDAKVGLVKGCGMKYPRMAPSIAVVDGEIFVFGGVLPPTSVDADAWAEVYNKVSNTWSPIQPPSDFVGKLDVFKATVIDDFDDRKRKRKLILVQDEWPVCTYISQDCRPTNPSEEAHNTETCHKVWEKTLEMIGFTLDAVERKLNADMELMLTWASVTNSLFVIKKLLFNIKAHF